MILVDTSVWIDHLRAGEAQLEEGLEQGLVLCHPFIVGELACGHIVNRTEVLRHLQSLPGAPVARRPEALAAIESHGLWRRGIGYIDVHLLASASLAGATLWTRDRRLHDIAREMRIAHEA